MYCAVSGSSNTVSVPSVTGTESLVQVTVVADPSVEIQVRVNKNDIAAYTIPPDIMVSPKMMGTVMQFYYIRESVDSLCRDGADTLPFL